MPRPKLVKRPGSAGVGLTVGAAQLVERPRRPAGWKRPRRKVNGSEAGSRRPLELDAEHDAAVDAGVLGRDGSTRAAPAGILRIERS